MGIVTHKERRDTVTASGSGTLSRLTAPAVLLRFEGAALLVLSILLYERHGGGWLIFALLILAPDLSMLGYLAGPRAGAAIYNAFRRCQLEVWS